MKRRNKTKNKKNKKQENSKKQQRRERKKKGSMMEVIYKKDGNQSVMIIKEENIDENDYKLQMVMNNNIEGIIPLSVKIINNKPELHYKIASTISLESMYAKRQMSGRDIYNLVKSIKTLTDNMKEYLLDINYIIFSTEFVYLKRQEDKYRFCYYPGNKGNFQENLREFFDKLLEFINHNDKKAVLIAYGIQQITIGDDFTIQDLMDCAEKNFKHTEPEYSFQNKKQDICENNQKEYTENVETVKERPGKKNFFKNIAAIFSGKSKYKDENELMHNEDGRKYDGDTEDWESINATDNMEGETEDATMLLTSYGAIEPITLRSVDTEEPMEITPNRFPCVLGKSKKSSDFYVDSPVVSRVHMRISEEMAGYFVEDLNSTNGTFVNGVQLSPHEPKEISAGDQITLANIDFIVE